ncbi:hypothetical protein C923_02253, partial [Plasmodium falciparum UGT5.1]
MHYSYSSYYYIQVLHSSYYHNLIIIFSYHFYKL